MPDLTMRAKLNDQTYGPRVGHPGLYLCPALTGLQGTLRAGYHRDGCRA